MIPAETGPDTPGLPEGYRLVSFPRIPSTNDEAKRFAALGEPSGLVVVAREQSAGRGRQGRVWVSLPGNLYLSLLLRPQRSIAVAPELGFVAAVAVADAVESVLGANADLRCKWPNDVVVAGCKISGILLESAATATGWIDWVVVGIGLNIAHFPKDLGPEFLPATALCEHVRAELTPEAMLEAVMSRFADHYAAWERGGFPPVREAWRRRGPRLGDPLTVRLVDRRVSGRFVDIDARGGLVLDSDAGRQTIIAGDCLPAAPSSG